MRRGRRCQGGKEPRRCMQLRRRQGQGPLAVTSAGALGPRRAAVPDPPFVPAAALAVVDLDAHAHELAKGVLRRLARLRVALVCRARRHGRARRCGVSSVPTKHSGRTSESVENKKKKKTTVSTDTQRRCSCGAARGWRAWRALPSVWGRSKSGSVREGRRRGERKEKSGRRRKAMTKFLWCGVGNRCGFCERAALTCGCTGGSRYGGRGQCRATHFAGG